MKDVVQAIFMICASLMMLVLTVGYFLMILDQWKRR